MFLCLEKQEIARAKLGALAPARIYAHGASWPLHVSAPSVDISAELTSIVLHESHRDAKERLRMRMQEVAVGGARLGCSRLNVAESVWQTGH